MATEAKATKVPSALIAGSELLALGSPPDVDTLTREVVPEPLVSLR